VIARMRELSAQYPAICPSLADTKFAEARRILVEILAKQIIMAANRGELASGT
jgi:hypothetical protein